MQNNATTCFVERACPEDSEMLSAISYRAKSHWEYPEEWLDRWMDDLRIAPDYIRDNAVYKLFYNSNIVGFCAIENQKVRYEITHLWVLPAYIGNGLGEFLLNESLNRSVKPRSLIRVVSDPNASGFYQKQGFAVVSQEESYPPGRFLPVLERFL